MRNIYIILGVCIVFCIAFTGSVKGKIVRYIDRNGNVQYVNTDYSKVPPGYMDQVKDQIAPIPEVEKDIPGEDISSVTQDDQNTTNPATSGIAGNLSNNQKPVVLPKLDLKQINVELFVTESCAKCMFTEAYLDAKKISYTKYDIDSDPEGRSKYKDIGSGKIPVAMVKDKKFDIYLFEN